MYGAREKRENALKGLFRVFMGGIAPNIDKQCSRD